MNWFKQKSGIVAIAVVAIALCAGFALAQEKPAELKIGITTFLTGPASVFGVPGKEAFDIMIEDVNSKGGIGGAKIVPFYIDEGVGIRELELQIKSSIRCSGSGPKA